MSRIVRMGYEIHIDCAGQVCPPVTRRLCKENKAEEDTCEDCGNCYWTHNAPAPALGGRSRLSRCQGELQGILCWTRGNARHAGGAFHGSDLRQAVDWQI
jgi:hypothetical protein